jgi:hypothetical protein
VGQAIGSVVFGAAATLVAFRVTGRLRAAGSPIGTAPAARATVPAHR